MKFSEIGKPVGRCQKGQIFVEVLAWITVSSVIILALAAGFHAEYRLYRNHLHGSAVASGGVLNGLLRGSP